MTARPIIIVSALALMLGGVGAHILLRPVEAEVAAAPSHGVRDAGPSADAGPDAARAEPDAAASTEPGPREEPADAAAPPEARSAARSLRVVALGWEAAAPAILGNGGTAPAEGSAFAEEGLALEVRVASTLEEVEVALARGGGDAAGADVACLPLPTLVAAAQRLAALEPRAFLVTGWSVGREVLLTTSAEALANLPESAAVVGEPSSPATFLAAFVLELAGLPPGRLRLVSADAAEAAEAPFAAVDEPAGPRLPRDGGARPVEVASTAEASRLVPFVLVASARDLAARRDLFVALARAWLGAARRVSEDVPAAARHLATIEGAPPPLEGLGRLGRIDVPGLEENAVLLGLAGQRAATLEALVVRAGAIDEALGLLRRPPRAEGLVTPDVVAALVRRGEVAALRGGPPRQGREGGGGDGAPALVAPMSLAGLAAPAAAYEVAFLAEVFAGARLRVEAPLSEAAAVVDSAADRHGVARARLEAAGRPAAPGAEAAVEVLAP